MHFLPASSLFLGLSSNASVRRPHREAWEDVEGTELDDVCDRLRRAECTDTPAVHATPPLSEEKPAAASLGGPLTPKEGATQPYMPSAAGERTQPSSAGEADCSAASPQHNAAQARSEEMQQHSSPEAACSLPLREGRDAATAAAAAAAAPVAAAASWEPSSSSSSRRGTVRGEPDASSSSSSLRRAPSTFSTSLPTAPYERLLFQRQQQRRLLQQQATLRSFPSISSTSGSVETLAAALQDKRHRQQQQQQQQQQQEQQQDQQQQQQQQHEAAPSPSEACVSPSRGAVAAELRGPCLPAALRLQLLQEALWTAPSAASSSLGRSERKWWSMDDRNLEAFMFSHHRTFLRRLGRGVPPAYRWRAWQANAFANLHVEVGYCQGMNFIAGLLLLVSSFDEFEAFSFFCFVMVHKHLKEFFRERFPLLRKYIRAFDDLAVVHLPKLREHFVEEGVMAPVYLHQWFEEIVKFLKSLKCSGGVDDFRIGKMLVKQAAKVQIPNHIMREISPSNLEAIIREAELEEEEESRSRNAAFIAAAAAVENTSSAASNPLAFIDDDDDESSLHKVVAGGPAHAGTAKSSACSTPREKAEEMVLIRSSSPTNPPAEGGRSCGVSTAKPWFSCNQEEEGGPLGGPSTSGFQSSSSAASACAAVAEEGSSSSREEKHFFSGKVESPVTRLGSSGVDTPEKGRSMQLPLHAEDENSTPPQEQESDDDGYELVEISNAERANNPALLRSGQDAAAGSRASSAFADDHEREGAGEREGSFMDAIAKLWLAGR
ncbi:hypothetical protein Emed_003272 [Eimeria media]